MVFVDFYSLIISKTFKLVKCKCYSTKNLKQNHYESKKQAVET